MASRMRQLKIVKQITSREEKSLEKYLTEVGKYNPLTVEQEVEAGTMVQSGVPALVEKGADTLVRHNLRFVISVAKQYQKLSPAFTLGDLINYGNEGLIKAAYRYDHTRGFKFISYSVWWIRQRLLEAISTEGRAIRIPLNQNSRSGKMTNIIRDLQQLLGREPSAEEITEEYARRDVKAELEKKGISKVSDEEFDNLVEKQIKKINNSSLSLESLSVTSARPMSLDGYVGEDESTRFIDLVHSDGLSLMSMQMDTNDMKDIINRKMNKHLSQREKEILTLFFGLDGKEARTLEEIGVKLELTRERVRQIKVKAIRRLRASKGSNADIKAYLN